MKKRNVLVSRDHMYHIEYVDDKPNDLDFLIKKLKEIHHASYKISVNDSDCYVLGNFCWSTDIFNKIASKEYPEDIFCKIIYKIVVDKNYIVNPPIIINKNSICDLDYVRITHNQQLIFDALWKQGSNKRYLADSHCVQGGMLYSEHSGGVVVKNAKVDNIYVFTDNDRIDVADSDILLPRNNNHYNKCHYLFHTHPNSKVNGGRINEGILYEFPSASDIFNFIKYYNEGCALASIVVAPEGEYVIRPIKLVNKFEHKPATYYYLRKIIVSLEKKAINDKKDVIKRLHEEDVFYNEIAKDITYIRLLNELIQATNIHIEYYPRVKIAKEWMLNSIDLCYFEKCDLSIQ